MILHTNYFFYQTQTPCRLERSVLCIYSKSNDCSLLGFILVQLQWTRSLTHFCGWQLWPTSVFSHSSSDWGLYENKWRLLRFVCRWLGEVGVRTAALWWPALGEIVGCRARPSGWINTGLASDSSLIQSFLPMGRELRVCFLSWCSVVGCLCTVMLTDNWSWRGNVLYFIDNITESLWWVLSLVRGWPKK